MISGLKFAFFFLASTPLLAFDLTALMQTLAQPKSGQVRFAELKKIQLLDAPIEARGWLSIEQGVLVKEIESPIKERLEIDQKEIRIIRADKTQRLSLSERPEAEAMVAGLRAVLTGEQALLIRHYQVKLSGSASKWTLLLTPQSDAAKRVLRSIQFVGRDKVIEHINTTMSNGDQTHTSLLQ
ncbi:MAG: hypothetical protein RLZZ502_746 [Pseudomonadota bacterium]